MKLFSLLLLAAACPLLGLSACGGSDPYDAASLDGTRWSLSSGVDTPRDTFLTLGFDRGRTGGWTGCNDFGVDYETDGDSMTLGQDVMSTDAGCGGTPEGKTEEVYLSLFFDVDGWRIDAGELVLSTDGDDVLRYRPSDPGARELVKRLG